MNIVLEAIKRSGGFPRMCKFTSSDKQQAYKCTIMNINAEVHKFQTQTGQTYKIYSTYLYPVISLHLSISILIF